MLHTYQLGMDTVENIFSDDLTISDCSIGAAPISQMMPVQSIICNPPQNTVLGGKNTTSITLKGVAWSGGGREIQRVDVSIDGGKTWTAAELYKPIKQKWNHHWAWTQFYKTIELPEEIRKQLKEGKHVRLDLVSKALNSDFNVQPERMEPYWNSRGIAINHWYHVNVSKRSTYLNEADSLLIHIVSHLFFSPNI